MNATIDYLGVLQQECDRLSAAAESAGPDAAVPSCPGWTVRDLLSHVAEVFVRVEATVRTRAQERIDKSQLPAGVPFDDAAAALAETLTSVDPGEAVWNWTVNFPKVAGFWPRRMAQEATIHRVDAELALGGTGAVTPVSPEMAVDGIDELFDAFLTRYTSYFTDRSLDGSMHVHATDAEGEWLVSYGDGVVDVARSHAKGDVAVRGTASDLLLLLWNRLSLDDTGADAAGRFEVFGDRAVLDRWRAVAF